jgi:hypothetical protein
MAVRLFLLSGHTRVVEAADSARLDGFFVIVTAKCPTTQRVDTLLTLRAQDVVAAEIVLNGIRIDYVVGGATHSD